MSSRWKLLIGSTVADMFSPGTEALPKKNAPMQAPELSSRYFYSPRD